MNIFTIFLKKWQKICKNTTFWSRVLLLFNSRKVNLQKVKDLVKAVTVEDIETTYETNEIDANLDLFDELRMVRRQKAEQENVPPYVILSDASLNSS